MGNKSKSKGCSYRKYYGGCGCESPDDDESPNSDVCDVVLSQGYKDVYASSTIGTDITGTPTELSSLHGQAGATPNNLSLDQTGVTQTEIIVDVGPEGNSIEQVLKRRGTPGAWIADYITPNFEVLSN